MSRWIAYHGVSADDHQRRFDELGRQGFRITALTVSGTQQDAIYSAVWSDHGGSGWRAVHGLNAQQYQAAFDDATRNGFVPILISATGNGGDATFAAVFEQGHDHGWFAKHGMVWGDENTEGSLVHSQIIAKAQGFIPVSLCTYGPPEDRRFAGIWHENRRHVAWSWWMADPAFYQKVFDAQVSGHMRPGTLDTADDGSVLVTFYDDWVGGWTARHNIDGAEYQRAFDEAGAAGRMPLLLGAGGAGSRTRYSVLFADSREPLARNWQVTTEDTASTPGLDDLFHDFMERNGIRAGSLCVSRNGRPIVQRGYTWAENGNMITQPSTPFRMASLSKLFTAAAITKLRDDGALNLNSAAYPLLGITSARLAGQTPDTRINTITVQQLVDHTSGLNQDIVGNLRDAATKLGQTSLSRRDLVELAYGEPLVYPPGMPPAGQALVYLNLGYIFLAEIVAQVSGRPFYDYLNQAVLNPANASDIVIGGTRHSQLLPGEVNYDDAGIGMSILEPAKDEWLAGVYGGFFDLNLVDGTGGMTGNAPSIARFISNHAVWGLGGRNVATRFGAAAGDCSAAISRGDGLDVCYMFNRVLNIDAFNDSVQAWLSAHAL